MDSYRFSFLAADGDHNIIYQRSERGSGYIYDVLGSDYRIACSCCDKLVNTTPVPDEEYPSRVDDHHIFMVGRDIIKKLANRMEAASAK